MCVTQPKFVGQEGKVGSDCRQSLRNLSLVTNAALLAPDSVPCCAAVQLNSDTRACNTPQVYSKATPWKAIITTIAKFPRGIMITARHCLWLHRPILMCHVLLLQIEDVVTATKAAQALVEEAHREIELSGIQPVLRLASLDAKIPLSLLRLPSDPSIAPEMPTDEADLGALTIDTNGKLKAASPPVVKRAQRTVSWNSEQLAQVMSNAAKHNTPLLNAVSTEAVAGSPDRDVDPVSLESQSKDADSSISGTTAGARRSVDRMVSPFAMTPAPSQS